MSALDNIKNEFETFYVVATSDTTYVHYERFTGREDTAWGDVLTAERFVNLADAEGFIIENFGMESDYEVKRVSVNITIC